MLQGKKIVLGVSGGIAAYKSADVCSRLKKAGCQVRVVMTGNATEFITPVTMETLSGNAVAVKEFEHTFEIGHISLAKWADAFVIAPATANVIAKMACGIADDLLTSTALAMICPILIAPAMNGNMYRHSATQENLAKLAARGVHFVGPESGFLACGDEDIGRMSDPAKVVEAVDALFAPAKQDFAGKTVLVTAGPTHEPIDPVRFIANRSSGRMGYALAEAALARGARVILASGPVQIEPPKGAEIYRAITTQDLYDIVMGHADEADCVIQCAAPADFRVDEVAAQKIKRTGDDMLLHLKPNPDISAELGRKKHAGQILVAFAAETNDAVENARGKLVKKNADFVVCNDVTKPGAGFDGNTNIVTIVDSRGEENLPMMSKRDVADRILDRIALLWGAQ